MKRSTSLISLASGIVTLAIATSLFAVGALSAETFFSAYTITGIFYIAMTSYTPRRVLAVTKTAAKSSPCWTRLSFKRTAVTNRILRTEKFSA